MHRYGKYRLWHKARFGLEFDWDKHHRCEVTLYIWDWAFWFSFTTLH